MPGASRHKANVILRHVGHGDDIRLPVEGSRKAAPAEACSEHECPLIDVVVGIGDALLVGGDRGAGDQGQGSAGRA